MSYQCPKCSSPMEPGFILDRTIALNLPSYWLPGDWKPPKVDLNLERYMARLGEAFSRLAGGETRKSIGIRVQTFRCTKCGFLESYASDDPESSEPDRLTE